jgi:hypothetical protein
VAIVVVVALLVTKEVIVAIDVRIILVVAW